MSTSEPYVARVLRYGMILMGWGLVLMVVQLGLEFWLLNKLVRSAIKSNIYYTWKPMGVAYNGIIVVSIGAALMALSRILTYLQWRHEQAKKPPT